MCQRILIRVLHAQPCLTLTRPPQVTRKHVADIMVPLSEVIGVKASAVLDSKLIGMITSKGFSRIPVFDSDFNDPVGILYLPDLITAAFEFDDDAPPVTVRSGECMYVPAYILWVYLISY